MTTFRHRPLSFLLAGVALLAGVPASAQEVVQPLPGTTDADALAADMRRVALNPRDVDALVDAARLSLRLDDVSGAASLLQRAENVDPRNPRVKAGQAAVLVQSERPGQALRYFAEAEGRGLDAGSFAADRGLAYDLTGQQDYAQRDYARALRDRPGDEETIRRYALSLGISGQRQRAVQLLDPLVRRSDRAAWRAQAFVLAMTGDVGGASRIAATMMPGGAAGLSAFFERLPTLSPADKAFAVHFGDIRATPERLADARLAPAVASLSRAPVVLASAQPTVPQARTRPERVTTPPVTYAANAATLPPPYRTAQPYQPEARPPAATAQPSTAVPFGPPASQARVVAVPERPSQPVFAAARESSSLVSAAPPPFAPATATRTPPFAPATATRTPPFATAAVTSTPPVATPSPAPAAAAPVQLAAATPQPRAPGVDPAAQQPAPVRTVPLQPASPVVAATRPAPPPIARGSGDAILARIIAGLSIPGSELGVTEPSRAVAEPARPVPGRVEPVAVARMDAPDPAVQRAAAAKGADDRRAAAAKAAAEKKALAEKKAAAEKKALADREAAEKRRIERSNPERIWVQVAGGAYEGDLPKAYAAVKAKAPAVFGARAGYTTPLRATNRVLTGPFKTDAEARAFVNDLSKAGVSAFTFTSDAGQPVARLGAKGSARADAVEDEEPAPAKKATSSKGRRRR